jgi:hypothetical protein
MAASYQLEESDAKLFYASSGTHHHLSEKISPRHRLRHSRGFLDVGLQMTRNDVKWLEMTPNDPKRFQKTPNDAKQLQMTRNGAKRQELTRNDSKQLKMMQNDAKRLEMMQNDAKRLEMTRRYARQTVTAAASNMSWPIKRSADLEGDIILGKKK